MRSISPIIVLVLIIVIIATTVGIFYVHNMLSNKPISITIYNTQSISTPSPFQQDIAICNGTINIGPNFAYVNDPTLFNQINPNGQNVYFVNNSGNILYSWYEGQLNYNGVTCYVWWINLPNGIPANSNVTIYMYIGPNSTNYYQQYYPYVGASPQVISGYDNGNYTFIAYGYFNNTFDGWSGYMVWPLAVTSEGIELSSIGGGIAYTLPPNNWNIPQIPLIVEEAWYYDSTYDQNGIVLFGDTNNQLYGFISNLSTYSYFIFSYGITYLISAVTNQVLNYTASSLPSGGTVYSYLVVNSTYAQTGYYIYNSNQVWAPLTLLDTYNINNNRYTYSNLNYNPYQYPTLEISITGRGGTQYLQWVVARAYPPNGVMPSIYIG